MRISVETAYLSWYTIRGLRVSPAAIRRSARALCGSLDPLLVRTSTGRSHDSRALSGSHPFWRPKTKQTLARLPCFGTPSGVRTTRGGSENVEKWRFIRTARSDLPKELPKDAFLIRINPFGVYDPDRALQ